MEGQIIVVPSDEPRVSCRCVVGRYLCLVEEVHLEGGLGEIYEKWEVEGEG